MQKQANEERTTMAASLAARRRQEASPSIESTSSPQIAFLQCYWKAKGAVQLLILCIFFAFGVGCVVGLIPEVLGDRYARLYHGYSDKSTSCSHYDRLDKPDACQAGADQAQSAAASWNVVQRLLSLVCNPSIGSWSDAQGRRRVIMLALALACVPPTVLVWTVQQRKVTPFWYNISTCLIGVVDLLSICFAALSDVVDPEFRTAAFGLLLAGVWGGFSFGPSLAMCLTDVQLAWTSWGLTVTAFLIAYVFLPETLSEHLREANLLIHTPPPTSNEAPGRENQQDNGRSSWAILCSTLEWSMRPFQRLEILNRHSTIRLVTVASFLSSMVYASDATLVIYYIEDQLNVRKDDLAYMFVVLGVTGIASQAGLLQPLIKLCKGERQVLLVAFCCGCVHNALYGLARGKSTIYVALALSQLTKLNTPILSSLAAQGASQQEQGKIQGALFATNALAYALGPLTMEWVYHLTEKSSLPGTMFLYAAALYLLGTGVVSFLPRKEEEEIADDPVLTEPLLLPVEEEGHEV